MAKNAHPGESPLQSHGEATVSHSVITRAQLDAALTPGGLSVLAQPFARRAGGQTHIRGVELLVRGLEGGESSLMPLDLFDAAERSGQERALDRAALTACLDVLKELPTGLHANINLRAPSLVADPDLGDFLVKCLRESSVNADLLSLELSHCASVFDVPEFQRQLSALRGRGVRIEVDGVGAGNCAFSTAVRHDVSRLKLSPRFVADIRQKAVAESAARAIVAFAKDAGIEVTAVGVEDASTLTLLEGLGITMWQGFLLSKPVPVAEVGAKALKDMRSKGRSLSPEAESKPRSSGPLTVALIDDSPTARTWFAATMKTRGIRTVVLETPIGASVALSNEKPNLVLVDVNMPSLSGERLIPFLKQTTALWETKFLLYSHSDLERLEQLKRESGADGFIRKTSDADEFFRLLQPYLRGIDDAAGGR